VGEKAPDQEALKQVYEGLLSFTMKRFEQVIQLFDDALEDLPHVDFALIYLKFRALLVIGKVENAKQEVKELLKACPQFAMAKYDLQNIGTKRNEVPQSEKKSERKSSKKKASKKKGHDSDEVEEGEDDGDAGGKGDEESGLPFFGNEEWDKAQILCMEFIQEAIKDYKAVVKEAKEKQKALERAEKKKQQEALEKKRRKEREKHKRNVDEEEEEEVQREEHRNVEEERENSKSKNNKKGNNEKKKGAEGGNEQGKHSKGKNSASKQKEGHSEQDSLLHKKSSQPSDSGCCSSCVLF